MDGFVVKPVRPKRLSNIGERRGMSGAVRIDRLLPQPKTGEDVRGHVQRMRHIGRDLRIADRSVQARLGKLRRIVAVDQVVDDTGMIRLLGPDLVEYQRCLLFIGVGLVGR
jgi:hypothetical protein